MKGKDVRNVIRVFPDSVTAERGCRRQNGMGPHSNYLMSHSLNVNMVEWTGHYLAEKGLLFVFQQKTMFSTMAFLHIGGVEHRMKHRSFLPLRDTKCIKDRNNKSTKLSLVCATNLQWCSQSFGFQPILEILFGWCGTSWG